MRVDRRDPQSLAKALVGGDRAALARAITLVESTRAEDRSVARDLLGAIWPYTGRSLRIALTGSPGVGKSTFADSFGVHLVEQGRKLAVLAIDPASVRGGGAILGDKTRMARLATRERAFIRPSSSAGASGGVALRTRDAIALCEAAGHDVVVVETVGAGQSEAAVANMTDVFLLLVAPGGGDELQGVKRGVMELADLLLVNRSDGEMAGAARRTNAEYAAALRLLRKREGDPDGVPAAMEISALEETGIAEAWERVRSLTAWRRERGAHARLREKQIRSWVRALVEEELMRRAGATDENSLPPGVEARLLAGELDPGAAASQILSKMRA